MRALIIDASGRLANAADPLLASFGYREIEHARDAGRRAGGPFDLVIADAEALREASASLAAASPRVVLALRAREGDAPALAEDVRGALEAIHCGGGRAAGARREPAAPPALAGDVAWLGGLRLLEVLTFAECSGMLEIEATEPGRVEVLDGRLFSASYGELRGEVALFEIAALETGTFRFVPGTPSGSANLLRTTESLLAEALRRSERAAGCAAR